MKRIPIGFLKTIAVASALLSLTVICSQTVLFSLSPLKIGYHRYDRPQFTIFTMQKIGDLHEDYFRIDEILEENEKTHEMKYRDKADIVICETLSELALYLPFVGIATLDNSCGFGFWPNTVYVSPNLKTRYDSPSGILKHELSHILLIQNYGLLNTTVLWGKSEWIPEGFATWATGFPDYFGKSELPRKMKEAGIDYAADSTTVLAGKNPNRVGLPLRFMIYKYFITYLAEAHGRERFISFMKTCAADPGGVDSIFQKSYGFDFRKALEYFDRWLSK